MGHNFTNPTELKFGFYWKQALLSILDRVGVRLPVWEEDSCEGYFNSIVTERDNGLLEVMEDIFGATTGFDNKNKTHYNQIIHYLNCSFEQLVDSGLVQSKGRRDSSIGRFIYEEFTLTDKGIDTAIKIQEHADNKQRFEDQQVISRTLKRNSNISIGFTFFALVTAGISLYYNHERLETSAEQLEISNKRLAILESNHQVNSNSTPVSVPQLEQALATCDDQAQGCDSTSAQ